MGLDQVRSAFFKTHPEAHAIDSALRAPFNTNPFFFMSEIKSHPDLNKVQFTLMSLGRELERRFGINGEVAVFFSPWADIQRRAFLAIANNLTKISRTCQENAFGGDVRFSPSKRIAIIVSSDTSLSQKVAEWSDDEDLVGQPMIAVLERDFLTSHNTAQIKARLMGEILQRLGERNLYRAQKPVVGDDFFGRSNMLRDLAGKILADQSPAIFGLRRSGKTSAIRELKRTMLKQNVVITIVDLQMVDEETISTVPTSIVRELVEDLRFAKEKQLKVFVGPDADRHAETVSVVSFADIIRKIAIRNPDVRIVLAVDEIEHLESLAIKNPGAVKALLGALRSTSQLSPNVSLLFSGVVNTIFLASSLGPPSSRVDNPMFGQVHPTYLKPFNCNETKALLNGIGAPMFVQWTDEAVDRVQSLTGGSPFFVRELAAETLDRHAELNPDSLTRTSTLDVGDVSSAASNWSKSAAATWSSIVEALENHYPDAAYLLSPDVDEASLNDWIGGERKMEAVADCLVELGFLIKLQEGYAYSETLMSLRHLGELSGSSVIRPASDRSILELIDAGESHQLEFKSSVRVDLSTSEKKKYIEDAVVKTVAGLLNSDGGLLLIGVSDSGALVGIGPDLSIFNGDLDRFERWLMGDLLGARIGQEVVQSRVKCDFPRIRGVQILQVDVKRHLEAALVDDAELYVRVGNQTRQLTAREMLQFARQRNNTD